MKDNELRHIFGVNLKRILRERKMTQKAFAERISITGEHVSRWVTGKTPPGWQTLCVICDVLAVAPTDLFRIDQPSLTVTRQLFGEQETTQANNIDDPEYSRFKRFKRFEMLFSEAS